MLLNSKTFTKLWIYCKIYSPVCIVQLFTKREPPFDNSENSTHMLALHCHKSQEYACLFNASLSQNAYF